MAKEYLKVGCALAEGVGGDVLVDACQTRRFFDGLLQAAPANVMAAFNSGARVNRDAVGGEDPLSRFTGSTSRSILRGHGGIFVREHRASRQSHILLPGRHRGAV